MDPRTSAERDEQSINNIRGETHSAPANDALARAFESAIAFAKESTAVFQAADLLKQSAKEAPTSDNNNNNRQPKMPTTAAEDAKPSGDNKNKLDGLKPMTPFGTGFYMGLGAVGVAIIGAGLLISRVHTSRSNEWLVRTGAMISGQQVGKTFIRWPFQHIRVVPLDAVVKSFSVEAMSREKLSFTVPATYAVAVRDDPAAVATYARLVAADGPAARDLVGSILSAVLEGETRALAANMAIEDVFAGRDAFVDEVRAKIAPVLDKYGLTVLNANVRELHDAPGSEYFASLAKQISAEARNKARAAVALADRGGAIAAAEREGETRVRVAEVEAETRAAEAQSKQLQLRAEAEVQVTAANTRLQAERARIEAEQAAAELLEERARKVMVARAAKETEAERAAKLAPAVVAAEAAVKEAEGQASAAQAKAAGDAGVAIKEAEGRAAAAVAIATGDASVALKKAEGEAAASVAAADAAAIVTLKTADADAAATKVRAEAALIEAMRKADGVAYAGEKAASAERAMLEAQSAGLASLVTACGGDARAALSYLALQKGEFRALADASASAVRGMAPKITVWAPDGNSAMAPFAALGKGLPPLLETVRDQTGLSLPTWLVDAANKAATSGGGGGGDDEAHSRASKPLQLK